ncbi:hypothetical protein FEM48_ZijujUnG0008500 [Ziziphus jujuba var. spinosa]|uniref:Uncharacterized protein n=1 Tax=Ziziphus jujuba var. spinosa TaxID=714518 RepID=A0A978U9Z8_ZIZJJ|nr:hypothetical protein FEM48_ZijujUnG0008500 [Ziziphus jujuba var. spinosa]
MNRKSIRTKARLMLNFLRPGEPKALFYVGMGLTLPHHSLLLPRSLSLRKIQNQTRKPTSSFPAFRCSSNPNFKTTLKTCKNCKTQFDPSLNHPRACRFHTAHFGGCILYLVPRVFQVKVQVEKQRGSLRAYTLEALWILPTLARFSNIGIVVGLKIPLTQDVLPLLTPPMMTDIFGRLPRGCIFGSAPEITDGSQDKICF